MKILSIMTDHMKFLSWFISIYILCISASVYAIQEDPFESINKKVFVFNETVDKYFLKPVSKTYSLVTPDFIEKGVSNIFNNVNDLGMMINNLLQIKPLEALHDAGRILINSSVGIGGFFDVATKVGLEKHEEDFGQTLGRWHVKSGPYIVLPFFGPSTIRDSFSLVVDSFLKPQHYINHVPTRNSIYGAEAIDTRTSFFKAEKLIQGDKYSFIRDVYLQRRNFLVLDGAIEDDFTSDEME